MEHSLAFLFGTAFVIGLSGAMMPGPVLTATIGEALKRGAVAGPLIVLGHALLELTVLALVVSGLAEWITRPLALGVLGVAGGLLMILLGADSVRTAPAAVERILAQERGGAPSPPHGPVLMGIVLSLSNPYWTVWWATIGLNLAGLALKRGAAGLASFYTGHILSDLAWFSLVAFAVATGRRICPPRAFRWLLAGCGLALIGLGAYFLGDGSGRLAALHP